MFMRDTDVSIPPYKIDSPNAPTNWNAAHALSQESSGSTRRQSYVPGHDRSSAMKASISGGVHAIPTFSRQPSKTSDQGFRGDPNPYAQNPALEQHPDHSSPALAAQYNQYAPNSTQPLHSDGGSHDSYMSSNYSFQDNSSSIMSHNYVNEWVSVGGQEGSYNPNNSTALSFSDTSLLSEVDRESYEL